jgi:hypothetical protein
MGRRNLAPEAIRQALAKNDGIRSFAARDLNVRIDHLRSAMKQAEAKGYKFQPAPTNRIVTANEVYLPTPQVIQEACAKFRESWTEQEELAHRSIFYSDYEIPTGMSFRTLDGRSR